MCNVIVGYAYVYLRNHGIPFRCVYINLISIKRLQFFQIDMTFLNTEIIVKLLEKIKIVIIRACIYIYVYVCMYMCVCVYHTLIHRCTAAV